MVLWCPQDAAVVILVPMSHLELGSSGLGYNTKIYVVILRKYL